jgi:alkylhydroperoxidase/carboxymuconolactone decarboxylase family protein YurZ
VAKSTGQVGVDWKSMGDDLSADDREKIERWYKEFHGEDNLDLAPFIPFWLNNSPGVLFRYRRWVETIPLLEGRLSSAALQLVLLHNYTAIGYDRGVLYEIIGARKTGATKQQVLDTMAFAYPHSGPPHMSPSCAIALDYMDAWDASTDEEDPSIWPADWSVDPTALSSGIDFSTTGLTDDELARLESWYLAHFGEVPAYVAFLARHHPEGLKSYRSRYEYPTTHALPKQLFPLFTFFSSAYQGNPTGMRRAIRQAQHLGVDKAHIVALACVTMVYLGDPRMDEVVEVIEPLLDAWGG